MSEGSGENIFVLREGALYTAASRGLDPAGNHAQHP